MDELIAAKGEYSVKPPATGSRISERKEYFSAISRSRALLYAVDDSKIRELLQSNPGEGVVKVMDQGISRIAEIIKDL